MPKIRVKSENHNLDQLAVEWFPLLVYFQLRNKTLLRVKQTNFLC